MKEEGFGVHGMLANIVDYSLGHNALIGRFRILLFDRFAKIFVVPRELCRFDQIVLHSKLFWGHEICVNPTKKEGEMRQFCWLHFFFWGSFQGNGDVPLQSLRSLRNLTAHKKPKTIYSSCIM
jgi:hypothetical protein